MIGSNGRQDHVHQHGHRLPEAQFRQHRLRKPRHHAARPRQIRARHLPFVSDPAVVQHTVVYENLLVGVGIVASAARSGRMRAAMPHPRETVDSILERFNLTGYRYKRRRVAEGVRKLLDIRMAMAVKPKILLLDEPTSGVVGGQKFG